MQRAGLLVILSWLASGTALPSPESSYSAQPTPDPRHFFSLFSARRLFEIAPLQKDGKRITTANEDKGDCRERVVRGRASGGARGDEARTELCRS